MTASAEDQEQDLELLIAQTGPEIEAERVPFGASKVGLPARVAQAVATFRAAQRERRERLEPLLGPTLYAQLEEEIREIQNEHIALSAFFDAFEERQRNALGALQTQNRERREILKDALGENLALHILEDLTRRVNGIRYPLDREDDLG